MKPHARAGIALTASSVLLLAGCSSADDSANDATSLTVAAAFYPLQFVAENVGGDHVSVSSLTPAGVEPHDIELSPVVVRSLDDTDVVLYIDEFQPAVEDAIGTTGVNAFDASSVISLHAAEEHDHEEGEEDHATEEEHDHGSSDPHFWLEPGLLATYAVAVGEEFASLDPANADDYTANAQELADELNALDAEFSTGLAQCERDDIVTAHEAFGYLAEAFGLHQHGIAGLDPESEPSPARLLEIKDLIEETGATTIFTEALVSPTVSESLAADTGVKTAVLEPIESVADGDDYVSVMHRNLAALTEALGCE